MKRSLISPTAICLAVLTLVSGCSVLEEDKVNYKSATKGPSLDVPPDLSQLRRDSRYALESTSATASGFANAQNTVRDAGTATNALGDVRMERSGGQRWLVVNRPADKVWPVVREFWIENGFTYTTEKADIGLLETEWAENRAKIPQDFIRRTLGKVLNGLYSTGERDKFRTRIERNTTGGVDIFVTHRGMSEEYVDQTKSRTIWQPRPNDKELEAEFLTRLMVKLGVSTEQAKASFADASATPTRTAVVTRASGNVLLMPDSFDVAWRRVGLALDRTGFTVEDRDRAQGIYFVRYVNTSNEEKGFFSKMFSSSTPDTGPVKYRVKLSTVDGKSEVSVQNAAGQAENSPITQQILKLLADDLR